MPNAMLDGGEKIARERALSSTTSFGPRWTRSASPRRSAFYQAMPGREHRRVLMARTRYQVYYRLVGPDRIRVVTIWGAVRGRGPVLR